MSEKHETQKQAAGSRGPIGSEAEIRTAYIKGLKDGIKKYAWWKDGTQYVGTCGTRLSDALKDVDVRMAESPNAEVTDRQKTQKDTQAAGSRGPIGSSITAVRDQINKLENTTLYGGPSEICGAIDEVDFALNTLRETVCSNDEVRHR